jgi:hypothetical protein
MNEILTVLKDLAVSYSIIFTSVYWIAKLGGLFFSYDVRIKFEKRRK